MPRRKASRKAAGLNKPNSVPISDRILRKRSVTLPSEVQDCIKVKTEEQGDIKPEEQGDTKIEAEEHPDPRMRDGRKIRETPCVGCLVSLAGWMPEDEMPTFCLDQASKSHNPS